MPNQEEIAFSCSNCDRAIIRDSFDHDQSCCHQDDEDMWFCPDCLKFASVKLSDSESEEDDAEPDGDWCYGHEENHIERYTMAGGSAGWWNYVVEYDDDGDQVSVLIENKNGWNLQKDMCLITDLETHKYLKLCAYGQEPEGWAKIFGVK